tara:strand:- start:26 stop:574 length:549 start_codon:yes stop_codon:yes gene_type:complete
MASKLDTIIDRLERLTIELDQLKRRAVPLLPIPKEAKAAFAAEGGRFEDAYREIYFDTVRDIAGAVLPVDSRRPNLSVGPIRGSPLVPDYDEQAFLRQFDIAASTNNQSMENDLAAQAGIRPRNVSKPKKPRSAAAKRSDKKLSKAFKMANAAARTKKGKLRKGRTQASIARAAQKLRKKMK